MHLLEHADRYGGDAVAPAAAQVWRAAQRKLDTGAVPEKDQRAYLSAVAESAEVAGWLLFDAGQWDAARAAFLESHMLAGHADDRAMQWFALDMLAMLAVELGRSGEALRIADDLLSCRVPSRVAVIARVRRGRALAQMGEISRSTEALTRARGGLEDSLNPRDPAWAWWIDQNEVEWHTGAAYLDLGTPRESVFAIRECTDGFTGVFNGRNEYHLRSVLLGALAEVGAWREAEAELESISALLGYVSSGRNRHILRNALRVIAQKHQAPAWLSDLVHETAAVIGA
jgi:tetratricopeptide (TPR) repeat protein